MSSKAKVFGLSCFLMVVLFIGFGCEIPGTGSSSNTNTTSTSGTSGTGGTGTGGTGTGGTGTGGTGTGGTGGTYNTTGYHYNTTGTGAGIGSIIITVGQGTKPQISWNGGNVGAVAVDRVYDPYDFEDDDVSWGIMTPSVNNINIPVNGISSPVFYGMAPQGAMQGGLEIGGLTPGVQYEIIVIRYKLNTADPEAVGYTSFIP